MHHHIRCFAFFMVLLTFAAVFICSCAVNPVSGKKEFMLMTEAQEVQLGRESDPQIVAAYGAYEDPELARYIDGLGQRLAKTSHRPNLQFAFRVLDTPVVNAFAVPGGFVYITRGILAYLNDEAELAGILGHEIGHITARHSAQQYSRAQLASLGLGLGSMISEDFQKYAGYANLGVSLLFLRFSRDNEREADRLGVEYSTKDGYDATRMADFFTTLERLSGGSAQGGLPGWFTTHPNPADRVEATRGQAQILQQESGSASWAVNREAYLQQIDGLVYGNDPRQGFVEGNTFYHPALLFQFPVPQGWQVDNLPTQVQAASPDNTAAILLILEKGTSPQATAQQFNSRTQAQVSSAAEISVNGLPAYRQISEVQSEQSSLRLLSYFIAKDGYIYTFHGLSAPEQFPSHQETFQRSMAGFNHLREARILRIEPQRLHVIQAGQTAALGTILQQQAIPQARLEELAIVNGMTLDQTVQAGSLIKIVPGQ